MKRSLRMPVLVVAAALVLPLAACGDDDGTPPVDNAPSISLTAPSGGEALEPGSTFDITWTATDDGTVVGVDLSYVADGVTETTIATGETGTSYAWTVPSGNLYGAQVIAVATDDGGNTAADTSSGVFAVVLASARGYVTSNVCGDCHQSTYNDLFGSGHPYKLNKVVNNQPPTYPSSTVPNPPAGFTWADVTYVIGGYGWKARFLNDSGYIMTDGMDGVNVQYNLPRSDLGGGLPAEWVSYHATDTERKPYDCGTCHTTGWQTFTDNGGVNQDGLPGILGTWEETGISCEQCHGAGVDHVVSKSASDITVDRSSELCGSCHFRDASNRIEAKGGFIRHHEQYDELLGGGKPASITCGSCHEPHIGTRYGNAAAGGITTSCESCHATKAANNAHLVPVDCESCHMARASKSARKVQKFEGDLHTHIFTINSNPFPMDSMWYVDPGSGTTFSNGFVTLDFVCYSCHTDPITLEGGGGSQKTLQELSAKATGIHN